MSTVLKKLLQQELSWSCQECLLTVWSTHVLHRGDGTSTFCYLHNREERHHKDAALSIYKQNKLIVENLNTTALKKKKKNLQKGLVVADLQYNLHAIIPRGQDLLSSNQMAQDQGVSNMHYIVQLGKV